ncbi:MAG: thioredoxin family protein [Roseburia sp.]
MAERVTKDTFEEKVLKSSLPVLIDFYSDSCVPCKKMSPVIECYRRRTGRKIKCL